MIQSLSYLDLWSLVRYFYQCDHIKEEDSKGRFKGNAETQLQVFSFRCIKN
jgi:hypothetical protein